MLGGVNARTLPVNWCVKGCGGPKTTYQIIIAYKVWRVFTPAMDYTFVLSSLLFWYASSYSCVKYPGSFPLIKSRLIL